MIQNKDVKAGYDYLCDIRLANPDNATKLSDLAYRSKAHWGYPDEFMRACKDELTLSQQYIRSNPTYILICDNNLVGFYSHEKISSDEVELGYFFIDPDWIGKGMGRKLMQHAKSRALQAGYSKMLIQSDPNAVHFYERFGAGYIGTRSSQSVEDRELPLYRVELTP